MLRAALSPSLRSVVPARPIDADADSLQIREIHCCERLDTIFGEITLMNNKTYA
jgi:hypothetical protein